MLPQISFGQSEYDRQLNDIQKEKMERVVDELKGQQTKSRNELTPFPKRKTSFNSYSKKMKSPGLIFIYAFLIMLLVVANLGAINSKKKKEKEMLRLSASQELSNKEKQVAAILEKKNLEKIVQEGLATTIIKVRCRSCHHLNDEGDKYCRDCGNKV